MRKKKLDLNKQSEDLHLQVDREREENKENLEKTSLPEEKIIKKDRKKEEKRKAKEKKKEAKQLKKDKKNSRRSQLKEMLTYVGDKSLPFRRQIRFRLVFAFCVPVLLIISLGVFSYWRFRGTIVKNYENSSQGTIVNSSLYLGLLMDDIETRASQLASLNDFSFYYVHFETNSVMDSNTYFMSARSTLNTLVRSSVGISSACAFGNVGNPMSYLEKSPASDLYHRFTNGEEGIYWSENSISGTGFQYLWMGIHDVIDEGIGSSTNDYAASYIRTFSNGDGYLVFDLKKSEVEKVLKSSILSKRSLSAFITPDGRETILKGNGNQALELSEGEKKIANQDFYKKVVNNDKVNDFDYVTFEGRKHLFVYSKIGDTGAMICSLIPQSDILSQLGTIRNATILFVLISCVIAIFIGLLLSTDIGKNINKFSSYFKQVSNGDFTIKVDLSRKDEFGVLAGNLDDMLVNIRKLIGSMASFGHNVSSAAIKVSDATEQILSSINEVSDTVLIMEEGINAQVNDTEKSHAEMTNFADQIGDACVDTEQVGMVADETQEIVSNGKSIVNDLMEQSDSTSKITKVIIKDIEELEKQSRDIGSIVETINHIASTTNLLSLNASIEAARAGEAGRGFAVVAEEVRKLAEQSVQAVRGIEQIIKSIQQKTRMTAESANNAEQMLMSQGNALNNTVEVFQDIDKHMMVLMNKIKHITENMNQITVSKDEVLDSIKNIAAVTQQTAAASEVVGETVNKQIVSVESLNSQAEELKEKAKELEEAITKFII
ncbi:MAG TPA: methyl-accepting chemotaxis protein [Clostridiales bacterium]|nr:methyl-accepting chemotaxis protein [Clostridiales bacterium]